MNASHTVEDSVARPTSGSAAASEIRARLHGMWAAVAPAWGEHARYADERGAVLTERMLELSTPDPASACSSSPAVRGDWDWPQRSESLLAARQSSPMSSRR